MYALNLFNVVPEIKTKYFLAAEIYYYFLREEFQNPKYAHMISELSQMLNDLLSQVNDLDILEYEIYLRYLIEFIHAP